MHGCLPATEAWEVLSVAAMTASPAPTDMPTSAAASAARSLMPSPQNMVVLPRPCNNNGNKNNNNNVNIHAFHDELGACEASFCPYNREKTKCHMG